MNIDEEIEKARRLAKSGAADFIRDASDRLCHLQSPGPLDHWRTSDGWCTLDLNESGWWLRNVITGKLIHGPYKTLEAAWTLLRCKS